jgi:hypothetical protein
LSLNESADAAVSGLVNLQPNTLPVAYVMAAAELLRGLDWP